MDSIDKRLEPYRMAGGGMLFVAPKDIKALLRDFATAMVEAVPIQQYADYSIAGGPSQREYEAYNQAIDTTLTAQQAVLAEWLGEEK